MKRAQLEHAEAEGPVARGEECPQGPGAPDTYYLLGPGLGPEHMSHLLESRKMEALRLREIK